MSSFLSRIKVKTALSAKRTDFNMSSTHVTTSDFYQNVPVYIHEMIPKETIKIDVSSFTRCAPMVNPLFGSVKCYYRAFFVPFRVVYPAWNDFIEGTRHRFPSGSQSIPSVVPRIQLKNLYDYVTSNLLENATNTPHGYDISYVPNGSSALVYKKYKSNARLIVKILTSLGYKLNWATYNTTHSDHGQFVSALPLLSFAKIWCDWFANPQYDSSSVLDVYFTDVDNRTLSVADIKTIFDNVVLMTYGNDYFVSAWDNPTSPSNVQLSSSLKFDDVSLQGGIGGSPNVTRNQVALNSDASVVGGAPILTPVIRTEQSSSAVPTDSTGQISQYILNALHSVTDYVKRFQMVGSRALDRYMAEYGIQLESAKLNRSVYLGKKESDFQIGDITQTSPDIVDGSSSQFGVGSYSGRMLGAGSGNFEYTTDEYGYLIITSFIVPRNNYVLGRPRGLFHISNMDFFKGDFDALGVQAIRKDEVAVYQGIGIDGGFTFASDGVFGFIPRYAEYKVALDNLSGDFTLGTKNTLLDGWYLARKNFPNNNGMVHNASFCYADGTQYNEIWQDGNSDFDHFFTIYRFDVNIYAPMKRLFDMYDYSNEDGKDMMMTLNGTNVLS